MEVQQVEVVVGDDGIVEIHVQGAKGRKCLKLTQDLETALGGQVIQREMTHEADEPETVAETESERTQNQ
jgi:hypothetical protein